MNIAFIDPAFHLLGGTEKCNVVLVRELSRWCDFTLFARTVRNLDGLKFKIVRIPSFSYPPLLDYFSFLIIGNLTLWFRRLLKREKYDLVITTGPNSPQADITTVHMCVAARYELVKKGVLSIAEKSWFKKIHFHLLHRIIPPIEKFMYNHTNIKNIICVSEGVRRDILRFYNVPPEKAIAIPNTVDPVKFHPANRERFNTAIREKHGLKEDDIVLLYVGSEFALKGAHLVIEALPFIPYLKAKLLVVGRGTFQYHRRLAEKLGVADRVIFAGFSDDVRQYYAAGDIFVYPTFYEAFSLITLEAAASGLPLVAAKVNGTEELIVDGHNGFFVKHDAKDIAEKVNRLIEDEALRQQMSINIRKSAEQFSPEEMARKTMQVYESILKGK
ncbi:MAG: glycosyltransferase family 4 protein [Deltaproteobacteria bacterium]|nr:glycosyltransferase family 4 protein [Deltaproteobacteria bacterium]